MKNIIDSPACGRILALTLSLAALPASADVFHYNNMLIGDRATGMGGAYTAVSDDPSGLYYNPSGIAFAAGSSINGSVNAFHFSNSEYKNVLGSKSWVRHSSAYVPNFFGIIRPFAFGMVGFSVVVTDAVFDDQDQRFQNFTPAGGETVSDYYINFNNQDMTYNIGPSFGFKLRDDLAIGATLYGHYRKEQFILNQQVYLANGTQVWTNDYYETVEYGVNPVVGLMWSPMHRVSVGASVRKTILLQADTRLQSTAKGADTTVISLPTVRRSERRRDMPLNVNAGLAWFPNDRWLISGDLAWFESVESFVSVLNFALGAEVYLTPRWALRAGTFSNLANTPVLRDDRLDQNEHVDLYGGSLSVTHFTRNSSLSFGVAGSYGTGHAQLLRGLSTLQELEVWTLTTQLSASTLF